MNRTITVQELAVVIATQGQNPGILNLDFLKYSGIVPADWSLARDPVYTQQVVQLAFQNGMVITAEPNRILMAEMVEGKATTDILAPGMARKLIDALPHMEYQAIGLNPRGYVPFAGLPDHARQYLTQTLIAPGPWQDFGQAPVRATINFIYTLESGRLNLNISEAMMRRSETEDLPVVVFSGSFNARLKASEQTERRQELHQNLDHWPTNLQTYTDLINDKFLSSTVAIPDALPNLFETIREM
ncbi:MAG: hypothetical protein F6K19_35460 [Cyanothece sp. SIO1E1]|nr:hypothetical protein [Cyanothece sp. SIO1E1]